MKHQKIVDIRNRNHHLLGKYDQEDKIIRIVRKGEVTIIRILPNGEIEVINLEPAA